MKRVLILFLALMLVLVGCDGGDDVTTGHAFSIDEDGYGVTDTVTGIHYRALDFAFEPATTTAVLGTYRDGSYTKTFYVLKDVDPSLYIADSELGVWYAGDTAPSPATMTVSAILVCRETAVSEELRRYTAGKDDAMIQTISALWFEGTASEYPATEVLSKHRIKLAFTELPAVYYGVDLGVFADGVYLYDKISQRAVAVSADLAEQLTGQGEQT